MCPCTQVAFAGNTATFAGGAFATLGTSTATFTGPTDFTRDTEFGGGIFTLEGTTTFTGPTTFTNYSVPFGFGGAVCAVGDTITLTGPTEFTRNTGRSGWAVAVNGGDVTFNQSSFT